jgi:hypothetical protein
MLNSCAVLFIKTCWYSLTVLNLKMPFFALKIICLCSFLLSWFGPLSMCNEVLLEESSVGSLHSVSDLR